MGAIFWPLKWDQKRDENWVGQIIRACTQAAVVWQWSRYLFKLVEASGKKPLLLNLDETSIPVVFTNWKGTVMVRNGRSAWATPRQKVTKTETRMYFTLVAIICDDPTLQPLLPQVMFVGASCLTQSQFATLREELPDNVYVKRMPNGWSNAEQHKLIIRILSMTLAPFSDVQPILTFDAAPLHVTADVLAEIRAGGLLFMLVPAKLTWLLQPLDTHAFLKLKLYLKQRFAASLIEDEPNVNRVARMVRLVISAIRKVLQGHRWQVAFQQTGLWRDQALIKSFIKRNLQYDQLPYISDARPSMEMLRKCWPKTRPFHEELVQGLVPPLPAEMVESPAVATSSVAPALVEGSGMHVDALGHDALPAPKAIPKRRLRAKTTLTA